MCFIAMRWYRVCNTICRFHIITFYCKIHIHCVGLFVRGRRANTHLSTFTSRTKRSPSYFPTTNFLTAWILEVNLKLQGSIRCVFAFLCCWSVIWCSCRKPIRGRVRRRKDQEEDVSRKEKQTRQRRGIKLSFVITHTAQSTQHRSPNLSGKEPQPLL